MSADDQTKAVAAIGNVSTMLRKAIGAALPVAPEQYLTIAIPGTVIDLTPIEEGGIYLYDASKYLVAPTQVRQAEGKLVDGMMPLSNIMIGNTGKSVSRSYARALDSLVVSTATINTGNKIRSPGDDEYKAAMKYLTTPNEKTGLTPVEVYGQKQQKWAKAQDEWDQAKIVAMQRAQSEHPADHVAALQAYNDWNQTHFRRYKSAVQAEWMDWVSNGHKYDVEYSFGTVDIDSVMARIENSKESMRISSLIDADGANEVQGVELTPKEWATMCSTVKKPVPTYTIEELNAEIARLTRMQVAYQALQKATTETPPFPGAPPVTPEQKQKADGDVADSLGKLLTAQAKLNSSTDADKTQLNTDVETARGKLASDQQTQSQVMDDLNKFNMANGDKANQDATAAWLTGQLGTVADQLQQLQQKRDALLQANGSTVPVVTGAHKKDTDGADSSGTDVAPAGAEFANPKFGITGPPADPGNSAPTTSNDAWTEINFSYSSQDQSKSIDQSSWGMSVGASVGWGLWSAGGNYAHDQSSSDMQSDMSSCDVNISFQALVVNIRRPWLYAELFSDNELDTATGISLSPGPENIQTWMGSTGKPYNIKDLARYNMFPAYPTSFIIAANTSIEFHGNTQHIEQHMSSQSNSGGVSVGYGPWSVNSSFHQSSSHQSFSMQATSTGCKLSFNAPQIIGWVSQILPALPRNPDFEPIVQNSVP